MTQWKYSPEDFEPGSLRYCMEDYYQSTEQYLKHRDLTNRLQMKSDLMGLRTALKVAAMNDVISIPKRDEMMDYFMGMLAL